MSEMNFKTRDGVQRKLGYAIQKEDHDYLNSHGEDPRLLMKRFSDSFPAFNTESKPTDILRIKNQGSVGACQGFSLSTVFEICYFLATGRQETFSAMAGYILSQRYDGLLGRDVGSTLSAGEKVATEHGLCLDKDWRFPGRYDTRIPSGIQYPFKLVHSRPTNDASVVQEAIDLGLPVHVGIPWGREMDAEHVQNFVGSGGGGHAITFWLNSLINSWADWNGDGMSSYSYRALEQMCAHQWGVFIIYAPDGMSFPDLDVVEP